MVIENESQRINLLYLLICSQIWYLRWELLESFFLEMTMFDSRQILPNLNVSNLSLHKSKNKFCCYTHLVLEPWFLQLWLDHYQEGSCYDEKWSLAALDLKKYFHLFFILKASPRCTPRRPPKRWESDWELLRMFLFQNKESLAG